GVGIASTDPVPFLERISEPSEGLDPKWDYTHKYAIGRYRVGLGNYAARLRLLGFSGLRRGLDIGCGAGQWSIAFLQHNRHVVGMDTGAGFIEIARQTANHLGL